MVRVAFQGELGAYSEQAARQHFEGAQSAPGEMEASIEAVACRTLEDMFVAVDRGRAEFGAVPVENSTAGSINKSYDLLLEHDLKIHGEVLFRVQHALLAPMGKGNSLTHVRSHHQALAQCEEYLNAHSYTAVPWYDTAGGAKDLAADPVPGAAAIASTLAARYYNLEIIEENIEDVKQNYTRFFIVGQGNAPRIERSKTSLVFAVPEVAGSLYATIGEFAGRGINLTKIESRPRRNRLWHYVFYLDLEGHYLDDGVRDALVGLLNKAAFVKLLGSYPAAPPVDEGEVTSQAELLQI